MGGPNPILARGKSWRTAVASTWADECRSTSRAWAALASPGPIALARSALVAPAGIRRSLPSGSVTRISCAVIRSGSRLARRRRGWAGGGRGDRGGWGGRRERRHAAPLAEIQRHGEENERAEREPARDAAGGKNGGFVGHVSIF